MASVGFVLNVWKRPHNLARQLSAVRAQTIPPSEISIWINGEPVPESADLSGCNVAHSSKNYGVWARFAFALNMKTDFICVLDDDTFPGSRWVENCLQTMEKNEGLLGTRGSRFLSTRSYQPTRDFGWVNPNEEVVRVDIVNHNWFFRREWLSAYWREIPDPDSDFLVGEDIHFSYSLQKFMGLGTYVPPHPQQDVEYWGSVPDVGLLEVKDAVSISGREDAMLRFRKVFRSYISRGFKLVGEESSSIVLATGLLENHKLKSALRRYPALHGNLKRFVEFLKKRGIHL